MVAAALLAILPGLVVALCAGFRRFGALGVAPLLSAGVIGVSGVAAPFFGMEWALATLAVGTFVASAFMALARWIGRGAHESPWTLKAGVSSTLAPSITWSTVVGLLVSALIIGVRCIYVFGSPHYVSQTADNIFHLNAIRYILDYRNASSLNLGAADGGSASFYPGAWHDLVSLVVISTGASIPAAVAASNVVIAAILWPLSAIYASRTFFGRGYIVDLCAGVLAASFTAFPFMNLDWGVLYPNFYGMSLVLALIALARIMLQKLRAARAVPLVLAIILGTAGITLVHPNTILTAMVAVVPLVAARLVRVASKEAIHSRRVVQIYRWALPVVFAAAAVCVWILLRPFPISSYTITWPPFENPAQATGEYLLSAYGGSMAGFAAAMPALVGLVTFGLRKPWRWLGVSYLLWGLLFVTVASADPSPVRAFLTGGWYDDAHRVAAGSVTVCLLLGVGAFRHVLASVQRRIRQSANVDSLRIARAVPHVVGAFVVVAAILLGQSTNVPEAANAAGKNYNLSAGSPLMSADEFHLYEELPDFVPRGDVIANNPWDGSAWAYMVSGTKVLFPHVLSRSSPEAITLAERLNKAASDPTVCEAVRRLHAYYAINSDELIYLPGNPQNSKYPGIAGLDHSPGFSLVASIGQNRLYMVNACGTPN
ncbi:DUF6541 family protein [Sinomonas notoginsengisoli]|uniref:DUF6541 family protein n=1 Tax=Sinomonas notoginsengisoli TaxID=1457311 RepID=UPI001F1F4198|nr:DUF6541 family protein [Sinomonas notoginsengisoli]